MTLKTVLTINVVGLVVAIALIFGYAEWRDWKVYLLLVMFVINIAEILGDIKRQKQLQRQQQREKQRREWNQEWQHK